MGILALAMIEAMFLFENGKYGENEASKPPSMNRYLDIRWRNGNIKVESSVRNDYVGHKNVV